MTNEEIARVLKEIGEHLAMQGVPFKPRSYERAALAVLALERSVEDIYREKQINGIREIEGVGASIAEKIEELVKTGRLGYYESLKKKIPVDLSSLGSIDGLGPKAIKKLYEKLGVTSVPQLEKAAQEGKIRAIEGFGAKSEENILKGIEFLKKSGGRFVLGFVFDELEEIRSALVKARDVVRVDLVGSARRMKETIGDADFLAVSNDPSYIMREFISLPGAVRVYAHGETKSAIRLKNGMDVDLRAVPKESYGAALNYFTGSKDHNIALREIAMKKGYKLNEYGLFEGRKKIAGEDEKEIYELLGLDYIHPEMRENKGEIELAKAHKLPNLISYDAVKGDLQVQTDWSDGADSIETIAREAEKIGLEYIAITDHTKRLAVARGLDEKRVLAQMREIEKISSKLKAQSSKLAVLKGTECDILKNGSLDLPDEILAKLDVVGVAIHSHFNLSGEEQTKRLIRAMENPNADIVFHPTGRVLNRRDAYDIDIDALIRAAKRTGTILEVNAYPDRLDLKDDYARKCREAGVNLSISSDAHSASHMHYLKWGIAQARRGWVEKESVVNTYPLNTMLKMLKGRA